jgi:hypothetical protein
MGTVRPLERLFKELGCADIRTAAQLLAKRMRSILQQYLPSYTNEPRPLTMSDLKAIGASRGIGSYEFNASLSSEGQLLPLRSGGFHIRTSRGQQTARARFTIAHEIGHTFLYNLQTVPARRLAEPTVYATATRNDARLEEEFCDVFAAELLFSNECARVALDPVRRITDPSDFLLKIEQVSTAWGISVLSTLSQLNALGFPKSFLAAVLRWKPHMKSGKNPELRVVSSYPRPSCGWFVPANKRAITLGFTGAIALYRWWEEFPQKEVNREYRRSGLFSFETINGNRKIVENRKTEIGACTESLNLWLKTDPRARWKLTPVQGSVIYRMYAVNTTEAYCLAVISTDSLQKQASG